MCGPRPIFRERRGQAELSKGERELTFGECPSEALVGVGVTLKSLAGDALSGVTWPGAARFPDVESEVRDMLIGDGVAPEPMMLSSNVLTSRSCPEIDSMLIRSRVLSTPHFASRALLLCSALESGLLE